MSTYSKLIDLFAGTIRLIRLIIRERPPVGILIFVLNFVSLLGILLIVILHNPLRSETFLARVNGEFSITSFQATIAFILLAFVLCAWMVVAAPKYPSGGKE